MEILSALEHHQAGRIDEALQIYQRILKADPDNADALHLMGNAAGQLGDIDASLSLIARANVLAPENTNYLASLGRAYRIKKQFDLALNCYARILELEPDNAEAHYHLANLEKSAGKYTEAITHYRRAVAIKPDFADSHHNLGSTLYALGKPDEALSSYEQALWCNLPETHNNIGAIYFDKGQFEQALACYRQAIDADANYAEAYNNIGNTLRKLGQADNAAAAFCTAIRIRPYYIAAYLNMGDVLMDNELIEEAANIYEKAISIAPATALATAPETAQAYFNLGVARNRQNRLLTAAACFEQALACRPGYQDALYNLGLVNAHLGRLTEAESYYRQVLDLNLGYLDAHINLSALLLDDGRSEEAKTHIDFAYSQKNVFERYTAGAGKTVLILFDAGRGNVNLTHLFNEKTNNIIDWMIEYAPDDQAARLPHYDLVFNAMGDADQTGDISGPVSRFLQVCIKPLLNDPTKVASTARNKLPALLEGIDHLLIAPISRFADQHDWDETILDQLPLLTRPVHTQGGIGLALWTDAGELAQYRAQQSGPLYVSRFIDYRSGDSFYRKYRIIFIDRKPYPYHMAISRHWMVHYQSADMESAPWKLEEEIRFLQDPETVLGAAGMQAIQAIGRRLDLDYAGIDFSLLPDGRILVFEANTSMLVHPEIVAGVLDHKNVYIQRIFDAFEALLQRTAGADADADAQ
ncbi:MAG: tetratricopeptide repeat protein [Herbaspirillum sp.]|nr:tetratricopeptide repeat protein [Herbaspirillum sp.]